MFLFSISIDISRDFSSTRASCCSRYLLTASFQCKSESHIVKILMDRMRMIILRKLNLHLPQDYLGLFHVLQVLFDLLLPSKQLPLEVTHLHFSVFKKIDKKRSMPNCQVTRASSSMAGQLSYSVASNCMFAQAGLGSVRIG